MVLWTLRGMYLPVIGIFKSFGIVLFKLWNCLTASFTRFNPSFWYIDFRFPRFCCSMSSSICERVFFQFETELGVVLYFLATATMVAPLFTSYNARFLYWSEVDVLSFLGFVLVLALTLLRTFTTLFLRVTVNLAVEDWFLAAGVIDDCSDDSHHVLSHIAPKLDPGTRHYGWCCASCPLY